MSNIEQQLDEIREEVKKPRFTQMVIIAMVCLFGGAALGTLGANIANKAVCEALAAAPAAAVAGTEAE